MPKKINYPATREKGRRLLEIGAKFGSWTVLSRADNQPGKRELTRYLCRCRCGTERIITANALLSGSRQKCRRCFAESRRGKGGASGVKRDFTGLRVGKLVVLRVGQTKRKATYYWLCQCDCGNTTEVSASNLTSQSVRSCGCLRGAARRKKPKPQRVDVLRRKVQRLLRRIKGLTSQMKRIEKQLRRARRQQTYLAMRNGGWTVQRIADWEGISKQAVSHALKTEIAD